MPILPVPFNLVHAPVDMIQWLRQPRQKAEMDYDKLGDEVEGTRANSTPPIQSKFQKIVCQPEEYGMNEVEWSVWKAEAKKAIESKVRETGDTEVEEGRYRRRQLEMQQKTLLRQEEIKEEMEQR